jgi:ABC-type multidrug transport system ATPase subunit
MEFFQLPKKKALKSFSVGQQNQFEVIMALSQGADYILMDEPFSGNDVFNREDFYKVLLGILEPNETILLSTHLLEEVEKFIDRAVLIHQGKLVGDKLMEELEDEGKTLMSFVKETYHYRQDRVSRALVPGFAFHVLFCRENVDVALAERVELVGALDVAVERGRQAEGFPHSKEVYHPVRPRSRYSRLQPGNRD